MNKNKIKELVTYASLTLAGTALAGALSKDVNANYVQVKEATWKILDWAYADNDTPKTDEMEKEECVWIVEGNEIKDKDAQPGDNMRIYCGLKDES